MSEETPIDPAKVNPDVISADHEARAKAQAEVARSITPEDVAAASKELDESQAAAKKGGQFVRPIPKTQREAVIQAMARCSKIKAAQFAAVAQATAEVVDVNENQDEIRYGTGLTDNFLPTFGINPILTIVMPGSSGVTLHFQGIEDYTPPARNYKTHTDVTLTGTLAGKELVTITVEDAATIPGTMIYGTVHRAAYDAVCGINYAMITLTLNDGMIYAGTGGLSKLAESQQAENNSLKTAFTLNLNGGWTITAGATGPANA